jgi:alpha-methylacyl-CoA racemase
MAPSWHEALNAGKESVVCDLKVDLAFGRALCARADVVLEGFRPGVTERLGVGAGDLPDTVIYCSLSGFGQEGPHPLRVGHDLNYLGYAGVLADTAPAIPPLPIADLAAGSLSAVNQIVLALHDRQKTGRGRRLDVSMTHRAHDLVSFRLGDDRLPRLLTGGLACYRIYATADGRFLTLGALEPQFFRRLCELIGKPELAARQFDAAAQEDLAIVLAETFAMRPLAEWLRLFEHEDVAAGPVNTLAEAGAEFGEAEAGLPSPELGRDTATWRAELGLIGNTL